MTTTIWFLLCLIGLAVGGSVEKAESPKTMEEQQPDLSGYFFKYTTCKTIDMTQTDEVTRKQLGLDKTNRDVQHFVTFRLCPNEAKDDDCNENYGEYIINIEAYLEELIPFHRQKQLEYCGDTNGGTRDDGECVSPEYGVNEYDMGFNSSLFPRCQVINQNFDENAGLQSEYTPQSVGAACRGVNGYYDKECKVRIGDMECDLVEYDYPFYALIYQRIPENPLISCSDANEGAENSRHHGLQGGLQVCQKLYERADAKCESPHGFAAKPAAKDMADDEKEINECGAIGSVPHLKSPTYAPIPLPPPTTRTAAPTRMYISRGAKQKGGNTGSATNKIMRPSAPIVGKMFLVLGTIAALGVYVVTFWRRNKQEEGSDKYEKLVQMNEL